MPTPSALIDFAGTPRRAFCDPAAILVTNRPTEVPAVLAAAEAAARSGHYVVGFLTYEAAPAFDRALRVRAGARMPLAWFGAFERTGPVGAESAVIGPTPVFAASGTRAAFGAAVARIRREIANGRTYQVNLTTRLRAAFDGDARAWYEALRRAQGGGYHAYIDTGDFAIVSASPELFFEMRDRRIRTRPMKGTRARGRWEKEDRAAAARLATSEKDRAENLMIVDLLRNDLGRIARTGSVEVSALFEIERYRTIHQMTSTIEAELRPDVELASVFGALFPCGSVTGAPKISTMQLIAELEDEPREVYCGAVGIIEPGGAATFSVPIRTAWIERATGTATYGSGAGITYDSDAAAEYAEVEAKALLLAERWPAFELLETMRVEGGRIARLERHLARLLDSARYFDVPVRVNEVRRVATAAAAASPAGPWVLRLLVDEAGCARTESRSLDALTLPRVAVALTPVSSADRFLYHKTTNRAVYEARLAERPEVWDVLLHNERGEVTEFTRGNVVVEVAGELLTPARECGLLAGTFRAELLEAGRMREAVILLVDLARAERVWLVNSVREWVAVHRT